MVGIQEILANKKNYGGKRTSAIKYIVIHYTANDGDRDESNGNYFKNKVVGASAHYFVDSNSITRSVPEANVAWAVGGNKYNNAGGRLYKKCTNNNSISIELCDDVKNGVVYPSAKTIENALDLVESLMKKYSIPKENVIRHYDVNGKPCPKYWVNDTKWKTEFWNKIGVDDEMVEQIKVLVDGKSVTVNRILKDGHNYIKIRDIADNLGYNVASKNSVVTLNKK